MKRRMCLLLACAAFAAACGQDGGTATIIEEPPVKAPVLKPDSIILSGPSCMAEVSVSGGNMDARFDFAATPLNVVGEATVDIHGGNSQYRYFGLIARAPGEAQVIVKQSDGLADTTRVRVLDNPVYIFLPSDTVRVAVGESLNLPYTLNGPCVSTGPIGQNAQLGDTAYVSSRSLSPDVVSVTSIAYSPSGRLLGVRPGTALVVVKYWGAVDTAVVRVFQR